MIVTNRQPPQKKTRLEVKVSLPSETHIQMNRQTTDTERGEVEKKSEGDGKAAGLGKAKWQRETYQRN